MRQIDSIKEFMGMSPQELKGAVEDRTVCTSPIHRIARNWSHLKGNITHTHP